MAQQIKNPPAMQGTEETWVRSPAREDSLEEDMATAPVSLSGKSCGWRSLGSSPRGRRESDTTEQLAHT